MYNSQQTRNLFSTINKLASISGGDSVKYANFNDYLSSRPESDSEDLNGFAVTIFDGKENYPLFPVKTAEDVLYSTKFFTQIKSILPDNLEKVAGYFLQMANILHNGSSPISGYPKADGRIISSGSIGNLSEFRNMDGVSFEVKEEPVDSWLVGQYRIYNKSQLAGAVNMMMRKNLFNPRDVALMGVDILDASRGLSVEAPPVVIRYQRTTISPMVVEVVSKWNSLLGTENPLWSKLAEVLPEYQTGYPRKYLELANAIDYALSTVPPHLKTAQDDAYNLVFPLEETSPTCSDFPEEEELRSVLDGDWVNRYMMDKESAVKELTEQEKVFFDAVINGINKNGL